MAHKDPLQISHAKVLLFRYFSGGSRPGLLSLTYSTSKVLAHFCGNLALRHLVNCFNADDASTQPFTRKTFFELALRLAGTKDKNRFSVAKTLDHFVLVTGEMAGNWRSLLVFRNALFRSRAARKSDVLLHV